MVAKQLTIVKDPWDRKFITGFSFPVLMELLEATRYMDIPDLEDLIHARVASLLMKWKDSTHKFLECNLSTYSMEKKKLLKEAIKRAFNRPNLREIEMLKTMNLPPYLKNLELLIFCAFEPGWIWPHHSSSQQNHKEFVVFSNYFIILKTCLIQQKNKYRHGFSTLQMS